MRVRASFTVENSYIIPLFTLIIVVMVILGMDIHDELILKAVCFQGGMRIEQEKLDESEKSACVADILEYVDSKTIRKTLNTSDVKNMIEKVEPKNNSPREFIRRRCRFDKVRAGE